MSKIYFTIIISALCLISCKHHAEVAIKNEIRLINNASIYPVTYESEDYQQFVADTLTDGKWVAYFQDKKSIAFIGYYLKRPESSSGLFFCNFVT